MYRSTDPMAKRLDEARVQMALDQLAPYTLEAVGSMKTSELVVSVGKVAREHDFAYLANVDSRISAERERVLALLAAEIDRRIPTPASIDDAEIPEAPEHPDKPARPLSDLAAPAWPLRLQTADGAQLELEPCETEPGFALRLEEAYNSMRVVLYPEQVAALVEALSPAVRPAIVDTQIPVGEDVAKLFEEALRARHITYVQRDQILSIAEGGPQTEVNRRLRDALEEVAHRLTPVCSCCGRTLTVHVACSVCDCDE